MPRINAAAIAKREFLLIPAIGLVLAGLSAGQLSASDLFDSYEQQIGDMDYEIIPISHHGRCDCERHRSSCDTCDPCEPGATDEAGTMEDGEADTEQPMPDVLADMPSGGGEAGGGFGDPNDPGYIDSAFIRSRVRVRYDSMQGANEPTRAEMWYPTIGNFGGPGPIWPNGQTGIPAGSTGDVDFQELSTYVEAAYGPCFSVFGEFPIRWVSDVTFANDTIANFQDGTQAGAGDIRAGVRYGLLAAPAEALTLQVRAWAPTGEARRALGVGHSSIDVALLYSVQASQRVSFFSEIQDWQTIDAGEAVDPTGTNPDIDLDANVLRYGAGFGYDLWQSYGCRPSSLTGLFEVVGWTVLEGATTTPFFDDVTAPEFEDASGDTIVNGKYGVRYTWSCTDCNSESVYVGYGHNWTDDRWYSDVFRLELSHYF